MLCKILVSEKHRILPRTNTWGKKFCAAGFLLWNRNFGKTKREENLKWPVLQILSSYCISDTPLLLSISTPILIERRSPYMGIWQLISMSVKWCQNNEGNWTTEVAKTTFLYHSFERAAFTFAHYETHDTSFNIWIVHLFVNPCHGLENGHGQSIITPVDQCNKD